MALAVLPALVPAVRAGDVRHYDDAALHAIQFLNADEGWAVGDEGVVWHTINGGRDWERQPTPVRATLRSVSFQNAFVGWAAGREELPRGGSVGVLLFTKDGGLTWHHLLNNALPGLHKVRFVNARDGFLLGDGSDQYPSGVFKTADGGRSWQPVKGPRSASLFDGAFQDGDTAALVGAWGRLAKMRHGTISTADVDPLAERTLRGVQLDANRGLAVGQGGAILFSTTSGARWGFADLRLSRDVVANLDFHGLHYAGDHAWVVGRPGSVILHSADRGKSWELVKTGYPLPLHGVFFLDDRQGWAVGELGTILVTTDGGKSWTAQHRGGERTAVLLVHAGPATVPVETVALLGGEEGYLTAGLRVIGPDPASATWPKAVDGLRFAAALRQAGGAAGELLWQFPLPEHADRAGKAGLLAWWNQSRLHAGRADQQLLRQLVLALRMWRPDVIITDNPDAQASGSAAQAVVAEALHEAFRLAADPKAFPEQIECLGLETWKVSKMYGCWPGRRGASVTVDGTKAGVQLGTTARDYASPAAALLGDDCPLLPAQRYYRLLDSRLADAADHRDLMDGVVLGHGGTARRPQVAADETAADLQKTLRARRAFEVLTQTPAARLSDPARTLAQIKPALAALPDDQGAQAAFALASQYAREGQWTMAQEVFLLMAQRYPAHPRTADAYRWLIRMNTSSEARRRQELGQFLIVTKAAFAQPTGGGTDRITDHRTFEDRQQVFLASQEDTRRWYRGSLEMGQSLAAFGPVHARDPAIQFCLQSARRQLGEYESSREWYQLFRDKASDGPWRDAAAAELWLNDRKGPSPKPLAACRQTPLRPFLDGRFDDACWHKLTPLVLRNAAGDTVKEFPTEAWLAYDDDFLYLALRCRHPQGRYVPPVKVRKRDEDMCAYDRVSLLLDLDRDYSTYFHFQVDQRGCLAEDCWGDRTWNPRWFVAVHSDQTSWQIEAAIPLVELTGSRVPLGSAWACNVVRVIPGRGVQAWSLPAGVAPRPEGMGLLMFTNDPNQGEAAKPPHLAMRRVPTK
jgi:photosystem II stability/assembly factor-like uncharacterized protein